MSMTGVRRPGRNALLALIIGLGGVIAAGSGAAIMRAKGEETALSAPLIGFGLFAAIMGLAMFAVFMLGVMIYRRVARGEAAIARWTLTDADLDAFRDGDARRNAHGPGYLSDYTPPRTNPPGGLTVIVVPNGVMIGDMHFGLPVTGLVRFDAVQMTPREPLSLEFRLRYTNVRGATVRRFVTETILLRVPLARAAMDDAARVLDHFQRVLSRDVIVDAGFWTSRIRLGLWAAGGCGLVAAAGYAWSRLTGDQAVGLVLTIGGVIFSAAGLIIAGVAWVQHRRQVSRA